jgi:hypothetical protein
LPAIAVLVAHGSHGDELTGVFQRSGQRVLDHFKLRMGIFFRKAPDFPAGGNRRIVVEIHLRDEVDFFAVQTRRDHKTGFGIAAEAGAVRHLDPFIMHQRLIDRLQWLGQAGADQFGVGLISDDQEFTVDETVGAGRIARARHRHGRELENICAAHRKTPFQ